MYSALSNNLSFVCLRSQTGLKTANQSAKPIILRSLGEVQKLQTQYPQYEISYSGDSTNETDPNFIANLTIKNKNNYTHVLFHISDDKETDVNMLKIVCDSGSDLEFNSEKSRNEFNSIIKNVIQKFHKKTNSDFSYSTPIEAMKNNFAEAIETGLRANYAIIKQPDSQTQVGINIKSLDEENIELQTQDHPLLTDSDHEETVNLPRILASDKYLKNVFSALLGLAA